MSVGGISFWQQDQNFWARAQKSDANQSLGSAVITQMFGASTTLATGLASIANQTALDRVNTALSAAVQSALQPTSGGSASSSSSGSSGSASSASTTASPGAPAVGTGTASLSKSTSLFTLGILAKGTISVSDGTNSTTYKSTGTDTVGDLINAINSIGPTNAKAAAWLDNSGRLVISGSNDTDPIVVGGTYASNVGFGTNNNTFQPTAPTPSPSAATSSSSASNSASSSTAASSSGTSTAATAPATAPSGIRSNSAFALQTGGTAELLLASSGMAGSILNLLA